MELTQEMLLERRSQLLARLQERQAAYQQAVADCNALDGAIQELDYWASRLAPPTPHLVQAPSPVLVRQCQKCMIVEDEVGATVDCLMRHDEPDKRLEHKLEIDDLGHAWGPPEVARYNVNVARAR